MTSPLHDLAQRAAARAYTPYSGTPSAAVVASADGRWIAAPRIESASFPLTVPALQGVWALSLVAGLAPAALAFDRAPTAEEAAFVAAVWPHMKARDGLFGTHPASLEPDPVTLVRDGDLDALAVGAADRAVVPASAFRVGAAVRDAGGRTVIGANVEHAGDWTRGLCAERVALVAARAAGLGEIAGVSVACVAAPGGSPCGGCRQLLAEQAAHATIRIWGGDAVRTTTAAELLPGAFVGDGLGD